MPSRGIYFFPLSRKGLGTGHFRRCFHLAGSMIKPAPIVIDDTLSDTLSLSYWEKNLPDFPGSVPVLLTSDALSTEAFPRMSGYLAVFDRRSSCRDDLLPWTVGFTPVLLDDDGPARFVAPFVLDTIPGPRGSEANEASPGWLNLPPRRQIPDPGGSILLSFGGEDSAGLTRIILSLLHELGISFSRIHLTLPPGLKAEALPEGLNILHAPGNLSEYLGDYGLVFCSYGLTAWEAIAAGSAVITADPSSYHAGLSDFAGFPGLGCVDSGSRRSYKKTGKKLQKILKNPEILVKSAEKLAQSVKIRSERSLANLLESLEAPESRCTACGTPLPPVIARFPRRSYYRCPECGIIGLYRFEKPPEDEYGLAYFQQEYKNQYGRSYLDDFQSIKSMGEFRLKEISLRANIGDSLLDIGCAYGPFLSAAEEAGYHPHGLDISDEAVSYVRENLGIPAVSAAFPGDEAAGLFQNVFGLERFDIITLWYVIEHFTDLKKVLETLNVLLPVDGVLAMSTPSASGISARRSLRGFLKKSPADHYSIWTPRNAGRILSRYGFKIYKIRITGHHPERFGIFSKFRIIRRFYMIPGFLSRIFKLGDTFEIYAVKERSLG